MDGEADHYQRGLLHPPYHRFDVFILVGCRSVALWQWLGGQICEVHGESFGFEAPLHDARGGEGFAAGFERGGDDKCGHGGRPFRPVIPILQYITGRACRDQRIRPRIAFPTSMLHDEFSARPHRHSRGSFSGEPFRFSPHWLQV
jgi:hypothetical protein